ncbi:TlpA family protein disulfide reductase [Paenibacillus agricola]|uniref:TlpA family protein disulfide reductase n=1 Tax=Paenibacillus agricola TaxID=2716264 RepID=A0ABX0JGC7_9BACL|nr:TlpA disulfide reductase family protein [Paenibacillus agricola]NHN33294.1 TlpA family protein disulfide reductase [Paenibacillus agricola]
MKKQWFILSAIILLGLLAIYQTTSANKEELPKVGYKAPAVSLQGLDGKIYSFETLIGKPVVLNFWASWCAPCKIEAPELVKLHEKYKDQVEIYAVNITASDSVEGAKTFANEYGFTFPVLMDVEAEVAKKYQISPIPTTYFINKEGIIVDKLLGLTDPDSLDNKFKQLIQ